MTTKTDSKTARPKTITVPLEEPVTVQIEGEARPRTFTELTLRRMKAKDSLVAESETNKVRSGYLMYAALAEVPLAVIEELDMEDIAAIGEAAGKLMGKRVSAMARKAEAQAEKDAALSGGTSLLQ